jgi:hypothetical protein
VEARRQETLGRTTCRWFDNIKMDLGEVGWDKIQWTGVSQDDRLCGLVVRVLGYRSGGSGSIPGTTRKKSSGSGTGSTQPREYN